MTSEQKIAANRKNARRSTGPRGAEARNRTRFNATRHGLAAMIVADPAIGDQASRVATAVCPAGADAVARQWAVIFAESEASLRRVRAAKVRILEQLAGPERAQGPHAPEPATAAKLVSRSDLLNRLVQLDRYERRAFSRVDRAAGLLAAWNV
jgi:hypothetical protein